MKIIFTAGAKTEAGWEFLLKMYSFVGSEPEKLKILESLASTSDVKKLIWYNSFLLFPYAVFFKIEDFKS